MDFKAFPFELLEAKAGSDGPQFSGYLSTFGNTDAGDDVVIAGAFDRTLRERSFRPLLWSHNQQLPPIGLEKSLAVDQKGLLGTWSMLSTGLADDVYKALKSGALRTMSMGYLPVSVEFDDSGARKLLDVELLESSLCNVPMNDQATVTDVKRFDRDVPFDQLLGQLKDWLEYGADEAEALYQRRAADERKLSDAHIAAVTELLACVKATAPRFETVLPQPPPPNGDLSIRLELARRRVAARALETSP